MPNPIQLLGFGEDCIVGVLAGVLRGLGCKFGLVGDSEVGFWGTSPGTVTLHTLRSEGRGERLARRVLGWVLRQGVEFLASLVMDFRVMSGWNSDRVRQLSGTSGTGSHCL